MSEKHSLNEIIYCVIQVGGAKLWHSITVGWGGPEEAKIVWCNKWTAPKLLFKKWQSEYSNRGNHRQITKIKASCKNSWNCHTRANLKFNLTWLEFLQVLSCELGHKVAWICSCNHPPTHPGHNLRREMFLLLTVKSGRCMEDVWRMSGG